MKTWRSSKTSGLVSSKSKFTMAPCPRKTLKIWFSTLFNEAHDLRRMVAPESQLHQQRDLEKLKALVQRTNALIPQIPKLDRTQLDEDMITCLKAIVWQPSPNTKKVKPALNVDDLDDTP
jgi:hypothetical protein